MDSNARRSMYHRIIHRNTISSYEQLAQIFMINNYKFIDYKQIFRAVDSHFIQEINQSDMELYSKL